MTLSEFIFRVTRKSALDDANTDEHNQLVLWANDAVQEILMDTHCVIETASTALTVGVNLYTIDPSVLAIANAYLVSANQNYEVEIVQLEQLRLHQRFEGTSPVQLMAIQGDRLYIYPTPDAADTIIWDYVPKPIQPLVNPSDDPTNANYGRLPDNAMLALEYYGIWQAAEYDDRGGGFWRGHAFAPGSAYKDYFDAECAQIRKQFKRRARSPFRPMVGYPGRTVGIPTRNDQDFVSRN